MRSGQVPPIAAAVLASGGVVAAGDIGLVVPPKPGTPREAADFGSPPCVAQPWRTRLAQRDLPLLAYGRVEPGAWVYYILVFDRCAWASSALSSLSS